MRATRRGMLAAAAAKNSLFLDTFTDANGTLLQNHTSDSGHTWSKRNPPITTNNEIQDGYVRQATNLANAYYGVNGVAQQSGQKLVAEAEVILTGPASVYVCFAGTNSSPGFSYSAGSWYYVVWFDLVSQRFVWWKNINGASSALVEQLAAPVAGQTFEIRRSGNDYTVYFNGVSFGTRNAVSDGVGTGGEFGLSLHGNSTADAKINRMFIEAI